MEAGAARAKHRLLWDRTVHGWRSQVHKGNTKDGPRTDVCVQGSKVRAVEAARMHSAYGACACWRYDAHLGAKRVPRPGNERLRGPTCALQVIDSAALQPSTFQARSLQLLDGTVHVLRGATSTTAERPGGWRGKLAWSKGGGGRSGAPHRSSRQGTRHRCKVWSKSKGGGGRSGAPHRSSRQGTRHRCKVWQR